VLATSPDGRRLAVTVGALVLLIDLRAMAVERTLDLGGGEILAAAFSPDGARLALGTMGGAVRLVDPGLGQEVVVLTGHADYVAALAWSPDGERLYSGSGAASICIWDARPVAAQLRARRERAELVRGLEPRVLEDLRRDSPRRRWWIDCGATLDSRPVRARWQSSSLCTGSGPRETSEAAKDPARRERQAVTWRRAWIGKERAACAGAAGRSVRRLSEGPRGRSPRA